MANDRSKPGDRGTGLDAEHLRVSGLIDRLEQAIGELERAEILRPDAAARLVSYRHSRERRAFELRRLEWEMQAHPTSELDRPVADLPGDGRPVPTVADEMLKQVGNKKKKNRRGWLRS